MSRKRLIILGIGVAVAALLLILGTVGRQALGTTTLELSEPVASKMQFPQLLNHDTVRYFNGRAFMKFNLDSQTSSALTPGYMLPNVLAVRWSDNGVMFKATGYGPTDQLRSQLNTLNLSTTNAYWWLADFKTGAITFVGSATAVNESGALIDDTLWSTDQTTYYYLQTPRFTDSEPTTHLFAASAASQPVDLGEVAASQLLWADSGRILYRSTSSDELAEYTITTKTIRKLGAQAHASAYANQNGSQIIYAASSGATTDEGIVDTGGPLKKLDVATSKIADLSNESVTSAAWSSDGNWAAAVHTGTDPTQGVVADAAGKIRKLAFNPTGKTVPNDLQTIGYADGRILLIDASNSVYIAEAKLATFKPAVSVEAKSPNVTGIAALLQVGVTSPQVNDVTYALGAYATSIGYGDAVAIRESSVVTTYRDPQSDISFESLTFNVTYGDKTYNATLKYYDLTTIELVLTDASGAQVYSSGPVNLTNG